MPGHGICLQRGPGVSGPEDSNEPTQPGPISESLRLSSYHCRLSALLRTVPRAGQVKEGRIVLHRAPGPAGHQHSARSSGCASPEAGRWGRWQVTGSEALRSRKQWQWAPGQAQSHTAVLTTWGQEQPGQQAVAVSRGSRPRARGRRTSIEGVKSQASKVQGLPGSCLSTFLPGTRCMPGTVLDTL